MKKLFKSFKLRLFLVFVIVSFLAIVITGNIVIGASHDEALRQLKDRTVNELSSFSDFALKNNYPEDINNGNVLSRLDAMSLLYQGRILVMDSDFKVIYDSFGQFTGKYNCNSEIVKAYNGANIVSAADDFHNDYIEVMVPLKSSNYSIDSKVNGVIYAGVSLESANNVTAFAKGKSSFVRGIMLIALIVIGVSFAFILAYPFSKISKQIKDFAAFDDGKIEPSSYTETDDIAHAFNELKVKLKILDDSRQEFVSNVSHELKTPITSIKVLADSLNEQEDVPSELYREFMQDIVDEIDRENSIITDLLSLVKLDKGVTGLNVEEVSVNEMLELIMKRLTPIADYNGVELSLEYDQEIYAEIDEVKMTLALTNLIENGIKYSGEGGFVRVALSADHTHFTVVVEDDGIGIAKEELDHIFERFYRVDKSHSREIGGTGLGLSISRKTILLHRGSVKADSEVGVGTVFTVRIPLNYVAV